MTACNRPATNDSANDGTNEPAPSMPQHTREPVVTPPKEPQPEGQMLAARKADSIQIEGTWQPITLKLYQPPSSPPFRTYVPSDMIAESTSSDEGTGHYFYSAFGGKRNDEAFLLVFLPPANTTRADIDRFADAFRKSREKPGYFVSVVPRTRGGRHYYEAMQYPREYGDGFAPRARRIMEEWKWLD